MTAVAAGTVRVARPQHILTINLEDYYHVAAFQHLITRDQWYRFETRLQKNTDRTLALLDQLDVRATFFVLGWIADRWPDLVRRVADAGHEVANRGFYHRDLATLTREEFREDLVQSRDAIEAATGQRVLGYRLSDGWLRPTQFWALDVLAQEGHAYDSSVMPWLRTFADEAFAQPASHETKSGAIWEVPLSTRSVAGLRIPIAGGNYFRQLPESFIRRSVQRHRDAAAAPFVMYFHTWELDADQPRISAAGAISKMRHYRNLARVEPLLRDLVTPDFGPVADFLGLDRCAAKPEEAAAVPAISVPAEPSARAGSRTPVTIVVPCFNEQSSIPYLANTLASVAEALSRTCEPHFILVDDCSTDETWELLQTTFFDQTKFSLLRHEENQGVSAAIMTGLRAAETEIVCSIDCDCSYDPHELRSMIPLLGDGVALVTASPYHPQGKVRNVPGWRLLLSRTLSRMYRVLLRRRLSTWTSCCRVYRRSMVADIDLQESGFLGTAELVAKLCLSGAEIVEHPATLEVRIFGESKMRTVRTIFGHLRLLGRVLKLRLGGSTAAGTPGRTRSSESIQTPTRATPSE